MTLPLSPFTIRLLAVLLFVLAMAAPVRGQSNPGAARQGGFAGVTFVPQFNFDGVTFDGQTVYKEIDGEELAFLPRVEKQPLFRGILGYRARNASLEISYDRTSHDASFEDFPMATTFQAVNVDGRFFFLTSSRVQPYALVGGNYAFLRIKDSAVLGDEVGDVRFDGFGVNSEAGVAVFPVPRLGIHVGYAYRVLWFEKARSGVSDKLFELRPRFRETAGSLSITGTYVF
jgi:hypothetical protein